MSRLKKAGAVAGILLLALCVGQMSARDSNGDARSEIDAFNKRFTELHLKMDTPGIMAMWAEDGVDLMQGESPIVGRKTITAWIENILSRVPGYKVTKEEVEFRDIQVCGDWASERATETSGGAGSRGEAELRGLMERWRWCCIARQMVNGRLNKKCGMPHRSLEVREHSSAGMFYWETWNASLPQRASA